MKIGTIDAMDEAFICRLFKTLTCRIAAKVAATEAYAAGVIDRGRIPELRQLAHIRPGGASATIVAEARAAFEELIGPCLDQGKDGAIEIEESNSGNGTQYCLIHLLRDESRQVAAVIAIIVRCQDIAEARQRLATIASYF